MKSIMTRGLAAALAALLLAIPPLAAQDNPCLELFELKGKATSLSSGLEGRLFPLVDARPRLSPGLKQGVNPVATYFVLPTSEQDLPKVFSRPPVWSAPLAAEIQRSESAARAGLSKVAFAERQQGLSHLESFVKNTEASFMIIIGHNEGGRLRLLDGSSIHLNDLAARVRDRGALPVIVSCKSREYTTVPAVGLPFAVTYSEAVALAAHVNRVLSRLATEHKLNLTDLQAALESQVNAFKPDVEVKAAILAKKTSGGLVILAIILVLCEMTDTECLPGVGSPTPQ